MAIRRVPVETGQKWLAALPQEARASLAAASELQRRSGAAAAEAEFRKCVQLAPENPLTHFYLGGCLGLQKRNAEAERELRKAIEIDPTVFEPYRALVVILQSSPERAEETISFARQGLELRPSDFLCNATLGVALGITGQASAAISQLEKTASMAATEADANAIRDALADLKEAGIVFRRPWGAAYVEFQDGSIFLPATTSMHKLTRRSRSELALDDGTLITRWPMAEASTELPNRARYKLTVPGRIVLGVTRNGQVRTVSSTWTARDQEGGLSTDAAAAVFSSQEGDTVAWHVLEPKDAWFMVAGKDHWPQRSNTVFRANELRAKNDSCDVRFEATIRYRLTTSDRFLSRPIRHSNVVPVAQPPSLPFGDAEPTRCTVHQHGKNVWTLELSRDEDRISLVGRFTCDRTSRVLRGDVSPVISANSHLRFGPEDWVDFGGFSYKGGGVDIDAAGLRFDTGTLRRKGEQVERFDGERWSGGVSAQ